MHRPTMKDVAARSGVSVYTVSRALSEAEGVSQQSRDLVLEAARELGYVPHRGASELRRNSRSSVVVLTASTSNAYYIDMIRGVLRTLRASGRSAVIADIAVEGLWDQALEDATVRDVVQARTAGVISTLTLDPSNTRLLRDWDIPMVFVDSDAPEGHDDVGSIRTDNVTAGHTVGAHLAGHGCRRWLFLAYPERWSTRRHRERGIRESAAEHDAEVVVLESDNDEASARAVLSAHLESEGAPDALIAGNNPMLLGAMECLHERGLRVPDDLALVSYDEFAWGEMLGVTVLNEDSEALGAQAADILNRLIDGQVAAERAGERPVPRYVPEDRREVGSALIARRSCGC